MELVTDFLVCPETLAVTSDNIMTKDALYDPVK